MKVNISDILKVEGASLNIEFDGKIEELNSMDPSFTFGGPVSFRGTMVNIGGVLKLDGKLHTVYSAKCYRCLKDITGTIDAEVMEDFVNAEKNHDVDAYTYEGNQVAIDKVLKDNIILTLPMKQVCNESCKGLCPSCGINWNENQCNCKDNQSINPRMEILKSLLNN